MKIRVLCALLLLLAVVVSAQAVPPPGWTENYQKAVEKAKAENKNLLLDFTGSDWCGYCMALNKEVFSTQKFKDWAKENVVLVEVDFPHGKVQTPAVKKQNAELESKFPTRGYPTIIIVDPNGNELGRTVGYSPGSGPDDYLAQLQSKLKK